MKKFSSKNLRKDEARWEEVPVGREGEHLRERRAVRGAHRCQGWSLLRVMRERYKVRREAVISLANKRDWSLNLLKSDGSLVRLNIVSSLERSDLAASMAGVMKGLVGLTWRKSDQFLWSMFIEKRCESGRK